MEKSHNTSQVEIEDKKGLKQGEAAQFILTLYCLVSATIIKLKYFECDWNNKLWIEFMFFGNLIWLFYLLLMSISKYKDRFIRKFFQIIDVFAFLFHLIMWVWLVIMIKKGNFYTKCNLAVDHFGKIYYILGIIGVVILLCGLIGFIFKLLKPKNNMNLGLNKMSVYDNDGDFNPYGN